MYRQNKSRIDDYNILWELYTDQHIGVSQV